MARDPAKEYGIELEGCPFCGHAAAIVTVYHRDSPQKTVPWYAYAQCTRCMAQVAAGQMTSTEEQAARLAAKYWNRRI